jgi:hypothetical protein
MKTILFHARRLALVALLVALPAVLVSALADSQRMQTSSLRMKSDTLKPFVRRVEVPQLKVHMLSSPLPVEISQQGRQLCIKSRYNQLLPIYTANGTYYSSLRLTKGTNWLTGLPRGAYMINNRRYTIN